ncbi:hypothetical protein UABAM_03910 [Candidatus Uabimicrobium amorphum]|uniref:Uncharacterized protein n=1 Tax=Uabimicrobium amorphum TaxID=2596890 RepID=A0A5S9IPY7_UABAM|nr:hypothetical protein UABAM_03910 [Candidatus Uabimicrobium amorphum]
MLVFELNENGTTVKSEVFAGLTTFLTKELFGVLYATPYLK